MGMVIGLTVLVVVIFFLGKLILEHLRQVTAYEETIGELQTRIWILEAQMKVAGETERRS